MLLYNHVKASRFTYDVVYTNTMRAGAPRGYGATQGQSAAESIINELADELNMYPCEIRFKNMTRENEVLSQYYNEELNACALDRCLEKAMEMILNGECGAFNPLLLECLVEIQDRIKTELDSSGSVKKETYKKTIQEIERDMNINTL